MRSVTELPVRIDDLDVHLKAIIKVKLREFIHLSPCFREPEILDLQRNNESIREFLLTGSNQL